MRDQLDLETEDFTEDELDAVASSDLDDERIDSDFPEVFEDLELDEARSLSIMQRIAMGRRMKRLAPRMKRKRQIASRRMADPARLKKRSRRAAIKLLRKRFAGKMGQNYINLSPSAKSSVDKIIAKKAASIGKIATRLLPKVRKREMMRFKKVRSGGDAKKSVKTHKTNEETDLQEVSKKTILSYRSKAEKDMLKRAEGQSGKKSPDRGEIRKMDNRLKGLGRSAVKESQDIKVVSDKDGHHIYKDGKKVRTFEKNKTRAEMHAVRMGGPNLRARARLKKAQEALDIKAEKSGIPLWALEEVFDRGIADWHGSTGKTPEQHAFGRVNSFISEGSARRDDSDILSFSTFAEQDAVKMVRDKHKRDKELKARERDKELDRARLRDTRVKNRATRPGQ